MIHVPALVVAAPLMLYGFYRRIHRNIARQKVQAWRLLLRSAVLLTAGGVLLFNYAGDPLMAAALAGGGVIGLPLALLGLRHTRFETAADGHYFTPNRILGVAISTIFIGRLIYRFIVLYPAMQAAQSAGTPITPATLMTGASSALTLALFGLVIGYFTTYCIGVLLTARKLAPPALVAGV